MEAVGGRMERDGNAILTGFPGNSYADYNLRTISVCQKRKLLSIDLSNNNVFNHLLSLNKASM